MNLPGWAQTVLAAIGPLAGLGGVLIGLRITKHSVKSQWLLDQKLRVYGDILRSVGEYSDWIMEASQREERAHQVVPHDAASTLSARNKRISGNFHAAYAVAPLFVGGESMRLLEMTKRIFDHHSDPLVNYEVKTLQNTFDALARMRGQLEEAARKDLG